MCIRELSCEIVLYTKQSSRFLLKYVNKAIWHLLHYWNRQFILLSPFLVSTRTFERNKRLHNTQFINHTARTIAEHKYCFSRLQGFQYFTQNSMFNMFLGLCFSPPLPLPPPPSRNFHAIHSTFSWWCQQIYVCMLTNLFDTLWLLYCLNFSWLSGNVYDLHERNFNPQDVVEVD